VPRGLPRAEGLKFAEARGEGRTTAVTTELLSEASRRPSGQRADANFHAAERRSASRRGSWSRVAPNTPAEAIQRLLSLHKYLFAPGASAARLQEDRIHVPSADGGLRASLTLPVWTDLRML